MLTQYPEAHVACKVTCATDQVHIFGEITANAAVDYAAVARKVISEIGYTEPNIGIDAASCGRGFRPAQRGCEHPDPAG